MKLKDTCWLVSMLVSMMLIGSGCENTRGKYTEEEMRQFNLANKYDLPTPSGDSMVLGVFGDTITSDEVLALTENVLHPAAAELPKDTFTTQARPYISEAIKGKITDILLYQEARKTAPDSIDDMLDKEVEKEVQRFIANYGNNYALAESKIKEMGMDWRTFREYQKKLMLTQSYLSEKLDTKEKRYSQQELQNYYNEHQQDYCTVGTLGFSLIEIHPDELDASLFMANETATAAARRIAAGVIQQLRNGGNFAETARAYHGDLAAIGGTVLPITPATKALPEPYNSLEGPATQLAQGGISEPVTVDGKVFIVRLDVYEAPGCKTFYEVQNLIQQQLVFEYQQKKYKELVNELVVKTDLAQMERFTEFCVRQAYTRWGQSS